MVPTYNRAHLLPVTLKSLQEQECRNFEIIIVDDGSTDNTEEVVKPFLNIFTRYVKKENAERAAARNFGARLASGKYVNFFDSDDLALPNHIAEAAILIELYSEPEWFHLSFEWVTPKGVLIKKINHFKGERLNDRLAEGNQLSCNGVFIRKDIFLQYTFNENRVLAFAEDYELWLRLAARFSLFYSNVVTSRLVDHEERSVRKNKGQILINSLLCFLDCVENDKKIQEYFGSDLHLIRSDAFSYISLHLSESSNWKLISCAYLFKALSSSFRLILSRRTAAIIRNLLFRWH